MLQGPFFLLQNFPIRLFENPRNFSQYYVIIKECLRSQYFRHELFARSKARHLHSHSHFVVYFLNFGFRVLPFIFQFILTFEAALIAL